jgi:hypothetical protein
MKLLLVTFFLLFDTITIAQVNSFVCSVEGMKYRELPLSVTPQLDNLQRNQSATFKLEYIHHKFLVGLGFNYAKLKDGLYASSGYYGTGGGSSAYNYQSGTSRALINYEYAAFKSYLGLHQPQKFISSEKVKFSLYFVSTFQLSHLVKYTETEHYSYSEYGGVSYMFGPVNIWSKSSSFTAFKALNALEYLYSVGIQIGQKITFKHIQLGVFSNFGRNINQRLTRSYNYNGEKNGLFSRNTFVSYGFSCGYVF